MFVFRQTLMPAARLAGVVFVLAAALAGTAGAATRDFYFDRPGSERGLVQNTVTAFAQDTQGYVWVATQGGLHRYDGQRYLPYRHNPRDAASWWLIVDIDGRVLRWQRDELPSPRPTRER